MYHSGIMADLSPPAGAHATAFVDLDQDLQQFSSTPKRGDVLYVLGRTMQYFVETFGEEKMLQIFRQFNGARSVRSVFKSTFGQDFKTIEQAWSSYLDAHVTPLK